MDIENILTDLSKTKFKQFSLNFKNVQSFDPNLIKLLDRMEDSFKKNIELERMQNISSNKLVKKFKKFNKIFNNTKESEFEKSLDKMNDAVSYKLLIDNNEIQINFLLSEHKQNKTLVPVILYAIHVFGYTFPYNYNGLIIDISLDNFARDINFIEIKKILKNNYLKAVDLLQKNSSALTVSGVTEVSKNSIILTKSEEITKLLFHELVHYIGLDRELVYCAKNNNIGFRVINKLNLYEAYAEFMSIILNSAYQTIHISSITKINKYDLFTKIIYAELQYSLYLSSNVLKLYGYDKNTYTDFFSNNLVEIESPIAVWEYILLRTQLLININEVAKLVGDTWIIHANDCENFLELTKISSHFINDLLFFMSNTEPINNLSYTMVEVDWNKI